MSIVERYYYHNVCRCLQITKSFYRLDPPRFKTDISNMYQMGANDKISIEYPPYATDTIEVACGTGLPAGFTSQAYTGSYAATAAPLALKITSRVLTPI